MGQNLGRREVSGVPGVFINSTDPGIGKTVREAVGVSLAYERHAGLSTGREMGMPLA